MKLFFDALIKFIMGLLLVGLFLFLPAMTFDYPYGWLFIALLFIPVLIMGIVLFIKAPDLLRRRLNNKENEGAQRKVIGLSALMFPIGFIVSALDFRFGWSTVPLWLTVIASLLFLIGYVLFAIVMKENAYLSRTVEVTEDQKVVTDGLYALVRHPMYLATLFMFFPIPIILGSFFGLIPFLLYPIIIVVRIFDEERLLTKELTGYEEYKKKTKYRLIPFIW